jgi:hypothetical protein
MTHGFGEIEPKSKVNAADKATGGSADVSGCSCLIHQLKSRYMT